MDNYEPILVNPGLLDTAERLFRLRLTNDPDNRSILHALSQVYRKQGKLDEAAVTLERLLQLDPDDQQARYMHAILAGAELPDLSGLHPAPFALFKDFLPTAFHDM